jgi:O-antigen/teichoic acid export membrane protein
MIFSLGLDGWLLRNGGRDREHLGAIGTACLVIKVSLGATWFLGVMLVTPYLNPDAFPPVLVYLSALSIWLNEIASTAWSIFKAALRNDITLGLMIGSQALLLLITLALAAANIGGAKVYLAGRVLTFAISSGISVVWIARIFGIHFERANVRRALGGTLPFAASVVLATIYGQADVTIIAHWLGRAAAGLYSPAISLITTLSLLPAAIYGVMLPVLSRSHAESLKSAQRISFRLITWAMMLSGVLGGVIALIAHPLVQLVYGREFALSGDVLTVLSGVLAFRCVIFPLAAILAAVGWQSLRVAVQAIFAVLNISLNILIVQRWGILGVAKLHVLTDAALMIGYLILVVWWYQKNRTEIRN